MVILSFSIASIAAISYKRTHSVKILKITVGFWLFFLKGIILTIAFFTGLLELSGKSVFVLDVVIFIDLLILIALYISVFKK